MMTEELSEQVETVYADVYMYPLALALLLLLVEANISEAQQKRVPRPQKRKRRKRAAAVASLSCRSSSAPGAGRPVRAPRARRRRSPEGARRQATRRSRAGAGGLSRDREMRGRRDRHAGSRPHPPNASFDLGLALFRIAERFGRRFGEEEPRRRRPPRRRRARRNGVGEDVDCALRVRAPSSRTTTRCDSRACEHYLAGNLEFLRHQIRGRRQRVRRRVALDRGPKRRGGRLGRGAAYNRAIASLASKRKRRKADAGPPKNQPDGGDKTPTPARNPIPSRTPGTRRTTTRRTTTRRTTTRRTTTRRTKGRERQKDTRRDDDKGNQPKPDDKAPESRPSRP